MTRISTFVLLHVSYLIGIGVTSLIARATGKHFLDLKPQGSTWKPFPSDQNADRMY